MVDKGNQRFYGWTIQVSDFLFYPELYRYLWSTDMDGKPGIPVARNLYIWELVSG